MYYVYVLLSKKEHRLYVGSTADVTNRLHLHNSGKVKSTQFYKPWELKRVEEYATRAEAFRREMFLKTGQQKEILRNLYC
ncbi:MAG: GIY-YIG nuclease family protein [Candidatus Paceibacterota bacterium]|jgi:putative endonuclease